VALEWHDDTDEMLYSAAPTESNFPSNLLATLRAEELTIGLVRLQSKSVSDRMGSRLVACTCSGSGVETRDSGCL